MRSLTNYVQFARRGVALITVLLIIMTLSVIAVFTLLMTKTETQASEAFRFNRQATYAAHSVSNHMVRTLVGMGGGEGGSLDSNQTDLIFEIIKRDEAVIKRTDTISPDTGLADSLTATVDNGRILGDLNRSITQIGSFEDLNLVIGDTVGMSDATMFCRYNMEIHGVAMAGRATAQQSYTSSGGTTQYAFTLGGLDSRVSARKYETAYLLYQPANCE